MPTPGLVPQSLRLLGENAMAPVDSGDVTVEIEENKPGYETDDSGNILRIEHPDGSVSISLDGRPLNQKTEAERAKSWFENLVDDIDPGELTRIADDLLKGIQDDIDSRKEWIEDRAQGIKLLGLKIEIPGLAGASDGAPVEGMSKVRHPLLLEACLRFQANARSELLPTDGPVKIRNDANGSALEQDSVASALEKDLNHYLTSVATEYYPDTDRMLLMLGFGGTAFKKVYFCPLRNRPVSETVDADDLIVNNAATDLTTAKRITHRVYMRPSTVKRLQILGVYRDVDLGTPKSPELDSVQRAQNEQQGISPETYSPDDRDREIYECYCELDIAGFEHKWKGKETGLEIPYRVTIDVSTKEILSIVRNYDEDTAKLPESRQNFVKYTFVPGMGFYDLGLLHILGNTTNAVTAAWREMLDAGMYANFPGFLMADTGARQNTNIFRIPPGGGQVVKTGGMPISQAVMPLPYKDPSGALMTLVENMAETGMRVGGTSEMQVGEGRADAPVGTTLAMIDQATKVLNSVHKRMHAAQANEFRLLVRTFRENPESFWNRLKRPTTEWNEQTFLTALNDCELVPQADPNTASQTQRLMKIMGLKQLQAANPNLYNAPAVDKAALKAMGWSNPEQFMQPEEKLNETPPEIIEKMVLGKVKMEEAAAKTKQADAKIQDVQIKGQQAQAALQMKMQELQIKAQGLQAGQINAQTNHMAAQTKAQTEAAKTQMDMAKIQADLDYIEKELHEKKKDRMSRERIQLIDLAQNLAVHPESLDVVEPLFVPVVEDMEREQLEEKIAKGGIMPPGLGEQ